MDEPANDQIYRRKSPGFGYITQSDEEDNISKKSQITFVDTEGIMDSYPPPYSEVDHITKGKSSDAKGIIHKAPKDQYQSNSHFFVRWVPALLALFLLCLMLVDQGTDIFSTYQICNINCQCVWYRWLKKCDAPATMFSPDDPCMGVFGNRATITEFCEYAKNETLCNDLDNWTPGNFIGFKHVGHYRHPIFCLSSFIAILGPSIINSTYLLISMWALYPSVLRFMGMSDTSCVFRSFKIILLVLYVLQILPYTWLAMNFLIGLKAWETGTMMVEQRMWDITQNRWKLIFSCLEDMPHLIIHSIFIINSIITQDNAGIYAGRNMLYIGSYIGVISSAASISLTLTLYKGASTYKAAFIHFFTTFISVGTRAGVCACYGTAIVQGFGPLTWPLLLAPVTAISLFTIENILNLICEFFVNFWQSSIADKINSLRKPDILKHIKTCTHRIISLTFEANSVQCLISAYTYLAFAVALNTAWISASRELDYVHNMFHFSLSHYYSMTQTTFEVLQYLACFSVLTNLVIVQREGKHKGRCLTYSLIFLMFMGGLFMWVENDLITFTRIFFSDLEANFDITDKGVETTLSSLMVVFVFAGVIVFLNFLLRIKSFIHTMRIQVNHSMKKDSIILR